MVNKLDYETEQWRPVVGYEGLYEVSSLGRVRSMTRERLIGAHIYTGKPLRRVYKGRIKALVNGTKGYKQVNLCKDGTSKVKRVHQMVWDAFCGDRKGMLIDHVNNNPSDNRVENLRLCTTRQNSYNRKSNKGSSSQYKGVSWNKKNRKWYSSIRYMGKLRYLGCFKKEADAAMAYDQAAIKLFGNFCNPNILTNG